MWLPNDSAETSPEMSPGERGDHEIPSVEDKTSRAVPAATTMPSPIARRFRVEEGDTASPTGAQVCSPGFEESIPIPMVTDSGTPVASIVVVPRKWGIPASSSASTRIVLPGPLGTWRVTVSGAPPATGTVSTMLSMAAPLIVKRIADTVEGIAAPSGRGIPREDADAGAVEEGTPPTVTVTAVVPPPVTADPEQPVSAAARRIPGRTKAARSGDIHHRVIFIARPLSWFGFRIRSVSW